MAARHVLPVSFDKEELDGMHPMDLLDPCCQKEVENQRHHDKVGSKLRESDRSQQRLDERLKAINSLRKGKWSRCECCAQPKDYPLLAKYRSSVEGAAKLPKYRGEFRGKTAWNFGSEEVAKGEERIAEFRAEDAEDSDWDSEDEAMLAGAGAAVGRTADETERLFAAEEAKKAMDNALEGGFGEHLEDSGQHVFTLVQEYGETVVCHVFQPELPMCAWLDLYLEKIASQFLGTRFRRVEASPDSRHYLAKLCRGASAGRGLSDVERAASDNNSANSAGTRFARQIEDALSAQLPLLVCFSKGEPVLVEAGLGQYGTKDGVFDADLHTLLGNAHVLHARLEDSMHIRDLEAHFQRLQRSGEEEDEEEEEENTWCDVPGCSTRYHHTHIGAGKGSLVNENASELGREAL